MNILVVDSQGGRIGQLLCEALIKEDKNYKITAVGTNSAATAAMLKGGAHEAATGENAVIVCAKRADIITGALGIVIADSMLGEITPAMALAIGGAQAKKILLPVSRCNNIVAGVPDKSISQLVSDAVRLISASAQS